MKGYKFKLALHKHYFDVGYGTTSLVKNLWFVFGFGSIMAGMSYKYALYLGCAYALFCYVFGWAWYRFGWNEAQVEVVNRINPFVQEMRKVYKA